jgi:parallel beta-helix repeat protein
VLGGSFEHYGIAIATTIDHSRIHGCGRLPRTNHDHGIYVEGSVGARITNNVIIDNADWGVHLYPEADRSYIANNVIAQNGGGIIVAGERAHGEYTADHTSDRNVIVKNVIAFNAGHNLETFWAGPVGSENAARQNCLWSAGRGNYGELRGLTVQSTISADPRFVARDRGVYRMASGSRCRAAGAGVR